LLHDAFSKLDPYLGEHRWLAGNDFSLADITWLPLHYTLDQAGFSFERQANVRSWARAISLRPSFRQAVVQWFEGPP
jgi:glutathione S-transferase